MSWYRNSVDKQCPKCEGQHEVWTDGLPDAMAIYEYDCPEGKTQAYLVAGVNMGDDPPPQGVIVGERIL